MCIHVGMIKEIYVNEVTRLNVSAFEQLCLWQEFIRYPLYLLLNNHILTFVNTKVFNPLCSENP